jgi:hypothetical protein
MMMMMMMMMIIIIIIIIIKKRKSLPPKHPVPNTVLIPFSTPYSKLGGKIK